MAWWKLYKSGKSDEPMETELMLMALCVPTVGECGCWSIGAVSLPPSPTSSPLLQFPPDELDFGRGV